MKQAVKLSEPVIAVKTTTFVCDGGGGAIGHPQVFLHINHETHDVTCPYCDTRYVLEQE